MSQTLSYSVAIRTLGKAGEKYQAELNSLSRQTVQPEKIVVYIAEGYPLPKETIGREEYVYVKKGMVAQRAHDYKEITTPHVLLLDDDVELEPDAAERLLNALALNNGDCIAADTFRNQDMTALSKLRALITNWALPRRDDGWAFKVQPNASFSYNSHPSRDVCLSQSAAGPASLWKTEALRRIRFADELWNESFGFAYGEDLLLFYKLYVNHGRLLVHYRPGITHLDAASARKDYSRDSRRLYLRSLMWLALWRRVCYDRADLTPGRRRLAAASFAAKLAWGAAIHAAYSAAKLSLAPLRQYVKGAIDGWRYVHSPAFKSIPNFYIADERE